MLVRFESKAASGFSMREEDAKQMLRLMGHSGTIPSAINGEDVPTTLLTFEASLQEAVAKEQTKPEPEEVDEDDDEDHSDKAKQVSLNNRAYPLHLLLKAAAEKKSTVFWDYDHNIL